MIAFLRAVNVGGRTAKSTQLITAFKSLGFEDVKTFLASGNVLFEVAGSQNLLTQKNRIESRLSKDLGFKTEVILRSKDQVAAIAKKNAFKLTDPEKEEFSVNVALFLEPPPKPIQKEVYRLRNNYDDFVFDGCELYWLCRGKKISDSTLFSSNQLAKALSLTNTMRNMRTFIRLSNLDA